MPLTTRFSRVGGSYYLLKLFEEFEMSDILGDNFFFPEKDGVGHIKNVFLEEDFCIRFYNFTLNRDRYFDWFLLDESLTPLMQLVITFDEKNEAVNESNTTLLDNFSSATLHNSHSLHAEWIPVKTKVQRIIFLFTWEWLKDNFIDAYKTIRELTAGFDISNKPHNITEPMNESFFATAREIAVEMKQLNFAPLNIKYKSLTLLNLFLEELTKLEKKQSINTIHFESIKEVEKILKLHLYDQLPNIESLASAVHLSTSTLQRHFKLTYGQNIYHYYLEQKFLIAKELIESKKKNVSEVAYLLGYHKINSFSKIFKKIFGVLPKDY